MKFSIICDEKPCSCGECYFCGESLEPANDNTYELINICNVTGIKVTKDEMNTSCPLMLATIVETEISKDD